MKAYKRLTEIREEPLTMSIWEGTSQELRIYNRLAELEDKIEDGTLIELPCKVGDTVYRVMADKRIKQPYEYKVVGFWYSAYEACNNLHLVRYINGEFESVINVPFSELNRVFFLTKAEAEKKLEELWNE